ncbi:hypothetical protein D9X30_3894 [Cupriavidus sp. U2]|nr:hypothetical protein D9X30_3894 [Cupriavidus sp. U2]
MTVGQACGRERNRGVAHGTSRPNASRRIQCAQNGEPRIILDDVVRCNNRRPAFCRKKGRLGRITTKKRGWCCSPVTGSGVGAGKDISSQRIGDDSGDRSGGCQAV